MKSFFAKRDSGPQQITKATGSFQNDGKRLKRNILQHIKYIIRIRIFTNKSKGKVLVSLGRKPAMYLSHFHCILCIEKRLLHVLG